MARNKSPLDAATNYTKLQDPTGIPSRLEVVIQINTTTSDDLYCHGLDAMLRRPKVRHSAWTLGPVVQLVPA